MALFIVRTLGWLFVIGGVLIIPLGVAWLSHFHELSLANLMPTLGFSGFSLAIGTFFLFFIRPSNSVPPSGEGSA